MPYSISLKHNVTSRRHEIHVQGISVEVIRKDIKNLHLGVYPPDGRVRVSAPLRIKDDAVRLAVIDRLSWIKRQRAKFGAQFRQSRREIVTGESHYYRGRRYRLNVQEKNGSPRVSLRGIATIDLFVRPGTDSEGREAVLQRWYREQLRSSIPSLLEKWQPKLKVEVAAWGIKKMKTKWGSCNANRRRLWFNLELAKKPPQCLEYIVVHELAHLRERHHNERFLALMDTAMPKWRQFRKLLNSAPLGHENWSY